MENSGIRSLLRKDQKAEGWGKDEGEQIRCFVFFPREQLVEKAVESGQDREGRVLKYAQEGRTHVSEDYPKHLKNLNHLIYAVLLKPE